MILHKTGHEIADTVSDLVGELPDESYKICYGILRHDIFNDGRWFEIDKGFWGAGHYDGNYRISYQGTQPVYDESAPHEPHGLTLDPWIENGHTLICPPTNDVCEFFRIDLASWLSGALRQAGRNYVVRYKGSSHPVDWNGVGKVITFNSTVGIDALCRGIPVISDPDHSTIGSYTKHIQAIANYDRSVILDFIQAHQFKLVGKGKIWGLIQHYLYSSAGMPEKP